jgi:hypothetical protein
MTRYAVLLATVLAVVTGCDSIDPTDQSFYITFRNDTGHPVQLKLCGNASCTHFDYSDTWKAGEEGQYNISDRDYLTRWLVSDRRTNRVLGCLPLSFDQKYARVMVRVSQMVPCPGHAALRVLTEGPLGRS